MKIKKQKSLATAKVLVVNVPKKKKTIVQQPSIVVDITLNGGIKNIMNVYLASTKEVRETFGDWYYTASKEISSLAEKYRMPKDVICAIVAVLSPGIKWKTNLGAAERVITNALIFKTTEEKQLIAAYPRNVQLAQTILETGDVTKVNGPKVSVFYNSLLNPESQKSNLTLDGHAINIWRGEKVKLNSVKNMTKEERAKIIFDYNVVADSLDITPQALQAITWKVWQDLKF